MARQWDLEASATQLGENLEWRAKNKVDGLKVWPAVLPVVGYDDIEKTSETTEERSDATKHGSRMYSSTIYKWDKATRASQSSVGSGPKRWGLVLRRLAGQ